jgi:mono/diheme cytochrome c family protein
MRSTRITALVATCFLALAGWVNGQTTFDRVYTILQNNCASCHGGATPIAFDLGTTPAASYAAIVGVTPSNPAAAAKGHKLVDPGHPYNSFLLKKIGASLDGDFKPQVPDEGVAMPSGGAPALSGYEAELIRQWIMTGAKQTGSQVDTVLIKNYYDNGGQAFQTPPAAPAVGTGFQLRFGPIFLPTLGNSGNEIELLKKEQLNLGGNKEVARIEADLNAQSHHFLLFMFDDSSAAAAYPQGIRIVDIFNVATDGDKQLQGTWQYDYTMDLPTGTAFYYDARDVVDLNYHLKNYSSTEILPADLYLNVYTQPRGTGAREMRAQLVNNGALFLLPGNNSVSMEDTWGGDDREIWMISSHTHKYGTDFDIFVRDSTSGNRGPQIYEGFYNQNYTFNQGFYDWEHPANRIFDPMYTVYASEGLIFDTDYTNTSGNFVTFGLTTNDEMQLSTYLYVNKHEVVVGNAPATIVDPYRFQVYPNPMQDVTTVDFGGVRRSGTYQLLDMSGKVMHQGAFHQNTEFTLQQPDLAAGVYLLQLTLDNGKTLSKKLLVD